MHNLRGWAIFILLPGLLSCASVEKLRGVDSSVINENRLEPPKSFAWSPSVTVVGQASNHWGLRVRADFTARRVDDTVFVTFTNLQIFAAGKDHEICVIDAQLSEPDQNGASVNVFSLGQLSTPKKLKKGELWSPSSAWTVRAYFAERDSYPVNAYLTLIVRNGREGKCDTSYWPAHSEAGALKRQIGEIPVYYAEQNLQRRNERQARERNTAIKAQQSEIPAQKSLEENVLFDDAQEFLESKINPQSCANSVLYTTQDGRRARKQLTVLHFSVNKLKKTFSTVYAVKDIPLDAPEKYRMSQFWFTVPIGELSTEVTVTRGAETPIPVIRIECRSYNCILGSFENRTRKSPDRQINFFQLPSCGNVEPERLARAFSDLISSSGGRASKY